MSPPITYFPAYLGLFASLLLGVICNAYLDIHYGSFGTEVFLWGIAFAFTLSIAWRQYGVVDDHGLFWQKVCVVIGLLATFIIFLPTWGMPRAGLYLLAALQAATNCVTVNRRKFRMALLSSAVMVMFSTAHYRADWTMLFYLVPYIFAVVFTLSAEQVCTRAEAAIVPGRHGGHMLAIGAAAASIIALTFVLYSLTPQMTWLSLSWKYGQASNIALLNSQQKGADGGNELPGGGTNGNEASDLNAGANGEGQGDQDIANGGINGPSGPGYRESQARWPTIEEVRQAAKRPGMPRWQATSIETVAEVLEGVKLQSIPLMKPIQDAISNAAEWCSQNKAAFFGWLAALIALVLLIAAWLLAKETRALHWIRMQFDYLRFGVLGWHANGNLGVLQLFYAMQRLLPQQYLNQNEKLNARDYLVRAQRLHYQLSNELAEATELFEWARYGRTAPPTDAVLRMRDLYLSMYRSV